MTFDLYYIGHPILNLKRWGWSSRKNKRQRKDYESENSFEDFEEIVDQIKNGPFLDSHWHFSEITNTKNSDKYWYHCKYKKVRLFELSSLYFEN